MARLQITNTRNVLNKDVKARVLNFFKSAEHVAVAAKYIKDKYTGERTGRELIFKQSSGYEWTTEIEYYFEVYDMTLPQEFVSIATT